MTIIGVLSARQQAELWETDEVERVRRAERWMVGMVERRSTSRL